VSRARPSTRLAQSGNGADYSYEFLKRLAHILVLSGHSPRKLLSELREICRTLKEPSRRWDPTRLGFLADLPHVIALWHSDPQYLGIRGQPAVLPLRGRGASLSSLIQRVLPDEDPKSVVRALVHLRGIRRRGTGYAATGRHLSYREDSGRVYSLNALLRMLRTVERNIAGAKNTAIFERSAVNPDFPVRALRTFHRRFENRASNFLWDTDGDMRRYEEEVSGGLRTRVGVEIFAFEEPPEGGRTVRRGRVRGAARLHAHARNTRRSGT
jgi:Family of unknown function (DUF6502)